MTLARVESLAVNFCVFGVSVVRKKDYRGHGFKKKIFLPQLLRLPLQQQRPWLHHTHLSGTGCIDLLDDLLMPATDDFKFDCSVGVAQDLVRASSHFVLVAA